MDPPLLFRKAVACLIESIKRKFPHLDVRSWFDSTSECFIRGRDGSISLESGARHRVILMGRELLVYCGYVGLLG